MLLVLITINFKSLFVLCTAQHCALHRTLVEGGRSEGGRSEGVRISMSDMQHALRKIRPSAMREVAVEVPKVGRSAQLVEPH